jgi:hypothetical protein
MTDAFWFGLLVALVLQTFIYAVAFAVIVF